MSKSKVGEWRSKFVKEAEKDLRKNPKTDRVHELDHLHRTWKFAKKIAKNHRVDREKLVAMVYLHDLGKPHKNKLKHGMDSARKAKKILKKLKFPKKKIPEILTALKYHDLTKHAHFTIEEKILFDADKLDSYGAIGVTRWINGNLGLGYSLEASANSALRGTKNRLKKLYTKEAKRMRKKDYEYTRSFMRKVLRELKSYD